MTIFSLIPNPAVDRSRTFQRIESIRFDYRLHLAIDSIPAAGARRHRRARTWRGSSATTTRSASSALPRAGASLEPLPGRHERGLRGGREAGHPRGRRAGDGQGLLGLSGRRRRRTLVLGQHPLVGEPRQRTDDLGSGRLPRRSRALALGRGRDPHVQLDPGRRRDGPAVAACPAARATTAARSWWTPGSGSSRSGWPSPKTIPSSTPTARAWRRRASARSTGSPLFTGLRPARGKSPRGRTSSAGTPRRSTATSPCPGRPPGQPRPGAVAGTGPTSPRAELQEQARR